MFENKFSKDKSSEDFKRVVVDRTKELSKKIIEKEKELKKKLIEDIKEGIVKISR